MSSHTVALSPTPETASVVGVDVGLRNLLTAAPANADPDVTGALVVDGSSEAALFDELVDAVESLQERDTNERRAETQIVRHYRELFRERFTAAAEQLVDYCTDLGADAVALEDLAGDASPLDEHRDAAIRASAWMLPTLQDRLEAVLISGGCRVEYVSPKYTTKACHRCQQFAHVDDGTITCPTDNCPVEEICRDRSAAVTIARRGDRKLECEQP